MDYNQASNLAPNSRNFRSGVPLPTPGYPLPPSNLSSLPYNPAPRPGIDHTIDYLVTAVDIVRRRIPERDPRRQHPAAASMQFGAGNPTTHHQQVATAGATNPYSATMHPIQGRPLLGAADTLPTNGALPRTERSPYRGLLSMAHYSTHLEPLDGRAQNAHADAAMTQISESNAVADPPRGQETEMHATAAVLQKMHRTASTPREGDKASAGFADATAVLQPTVHERGAPTATDKGRVKGHKPRRNLAKKTATAADVMHASSPDMCRRTPSCTKPDGHRGRCNNTKLVNGKLKPIRPLSSGSNGDEERHQNEDVAAHRDNTQVEVTAPQAEKPLGDKEEQQQKRQEGAPRTRLRGSTRKQATPVRNIVSRMDSHNKGTQHDMDALAAAVAEEAQGHPPLPVVSEGPGSKCPRDRSCLKAAGHRGRCCLCPKERPADKAEDQNNGHPNATYDDAEKVEQSVEATGNKGKKRKNKRQGYGNAAMTVETGHRKRSKGHAAAQTDAIEDSKRQTRSASKGNKHEMVVPSGSHALQRRQDKHRGLQHPPFLPEVPVIKEQPIPVPQQQQPNAQQEQEQQQEQQAGMVDIIPGMDATALVPAAIQPQPQPQPQPHAHTVVMNDQVELHRQEGAAGLPSGLRNPLSAAVCNPDALMGKRTPLTFSELNAMGPCAADVRPPAMSLEASGNDISNVCHALDDMLAACHVTPEDRLSYVMEFAMMPEGVRRAHCGALYRAADAGNPAAVVAAVRRHLSRPTRMQ